jgi:FtsZ-binding cell division protein ZapB
MEFAKRLLFGLLIVVLLFDGFAIGAVIRPASVALPYDPHCGKSDLTCAGWREFRLVHPFPFQTVAVKAITKEKLVIVISEPPSALAKPDLDRLIKASFGTAYQMSERKRWYIGTDGWVEDLVVTVNHRIGKGVDLPSDAWLRDRVALLFQALYGTTFGGDIEIIGNIKTIQTVGVPRFHVTPHELATWLEEKAMKWYRVQEPEGKALTGIEIEGSHIVGTFASFDKGIVMLTFPTELLAKAKKDRTVLDILRVPFREFAVSSDAVFGGMWTSGAQTYLFARVRTTPLSITPPLRFETFALLAAQGRDELAQSYERNIPFAGKLLIGQEFGRDWAPIYLSPSLVDTEFGALLNITDQMLKSWSESGDIEYVFFNYPKPSKLPFEGHALSKVVYENTKSRSVLFNWNTDGAAVVVNSPGRSILTVGESTSLPVTYGANGKPKSAGGADLLQYEEEGYNYFAALRDPNLSRVVQYTAIYQLFRAIANVGVPGTAMGPPEQQPYPAGTAVLANEVAQLIANIGTLGGKYTEGVNKEAIEWIQNFRLRNPRITDGLLVKILVNRDALEVQQFRSARQAEVKQFYKDIDNYNMRIKRLNDNTVKITLMEIREIKEMKYSLDQKHREIQERNADLNALMARFEEVINFIDIERVRRKFLEASIREPSGSIRTPSSVLSWSKKEPLSGTGGHNLAAKTLRLERSDQVTDIELVKNGEGGMILKYASSRSSAVEANAKALARAVEHGGVRELAALLQLIDKPIAPRTRIEALGLAGQAVPPIGSAKGFGMIGARVYPEKKPFVDDLRKLAAENKCCIFVARDKQETAYVTEVNLKPPPTATAYEVKDALSLLSSLKLIAQRGKKENQRAIIFLDAPAAHVEGLLKTLKGPDQSLTDLIAFGDAINQGAGTTQRNSGLVQADLSGKLSVMRSLTGAVKLGATKLLEKLGLVHPAVTWKNAKVARFEGEPLNAVLKSAGWEPIKDGVPRAIKVTFHNVVGEVPPTIAVVAGFSKNAVAKGQEAIEHTSAGALKEAAKNGASTAQYLMTVRNELGTMPKTQLQRLILVVDEKSAEALFTLLNESKGFSYGG